MDTAATGWSRSVDADQLRSARGVGAAASSVDEVVVDVLDGALLLVEDASFAPLDAALVLLLFASQVWRGCESAFTGVVTEVSFGLVYVTAAVSESAGWFVCATATPMPATRAAAAATADNFFW